MKLILLKKIIEFLGTISPGRRAAHRQQIGSSEQRKDKAATTLIRLFTSRSYCIFANSSVDRDGLRLKIRRLVMSRNSW